MSHAYPLKLYLKYLPNLIMLSLALVINIAVWVWIFITIQPQSETIFLHYNILFGVDYIGEWWRVFFMPMTGLLIFVLNFLVGWALFHKDKFVSIILNAVNVMCQILVLVASSLLIFLNV